MISIKVEDNVVVVKFNYTPELVDLAKSIFPHKWDKNRKAWLYPVALASEVCKKFGFTYDQKPQKLFEIDGVSPRLLSYQKQGLRIAQYNPRYCFWWGTGTGKTLLALSIVRCLNCKTLIVAKLSTLKTVWEETIKEFYPDMKYINLYEFKKPERAYLIEHAGGVHIINYEGFKIHFNTITKKGNYRCLIVDEAAVLKGRTTQIAKTLVEFGRRVEYVYLLSGLPAPNTELEMYPHFDLVAPGLLGYSFYSFRNYFFYQTDYSGYRWEIKQKKKEELIQRMKQFSMFLKKEDVLDLPERTFIVRQVEMTPKQSKYYREMKQEFAVEIGDITVVSPTVLSKVMKLRQITSGFLYYADSSIRFSDAKLNVLKEVLEEIGNQQVIIWCTFREEIETLLRHLPDAKPVYGSMPQFLKDDHIEAFKKGYFQYLVANPASLGHGQNLHNTSYAVFYSLDWSNELYTQATDRIYRLGQRNRCTYIHLLCKGTVDEIIYKRLKTKTDCAMEILEHLKGG